MRCLLIILSIVEVYLVISASSVNKPNLNRCATWSSIGLTLIRSNTNSYNGFVDRANRSYLIDYQTKSVQIRLGNRSISNHNLSIQSNRSSGVFVTDKREIYVDDQSNSRVVISSLNSSTTNGSLFINKGCKSLFVHANKILYCSINNGHLVVKLNLEIKPNTWHHAAGKGCPGPAADMLDQPWGIYVNDNEDLYIADTGNNRIQLYPTNKAEGITVADSQIGLIRPTSVILDQGDNLYIVDHGNHRIIRVNSSIYECIIGCSGNAELQNPISAWFDSTGNLYVIDENTSRIQLFLFQSDVCAETTELPPIDNCVAPNVTLFPGPSNFSNPLQFRRSQDFYISSTIRVQCPDSPAVEMQWSIYNCTPNGSIELSTKNNNIEANTGEIFIPARMLIYGVYEFRITIRMSIDGRLVTIQSAFVRINPSGITANLVQFGTSSVTSGEEKDLILDPGVYSINPDENSFNASDWIYEYQCRLYDSIEISRWVSLSQENSSCFTHTKRNISWTYNPSNASGSSLTIYARALKANRTYQFVVFMSNRRNLTSQATGFLIVKVDDTRPQMVAVACVISTMCSANLQFQYINPSTQVALFSDCVNQCASTIQRIQWNIYEGANDTTKNIIQWTPFHQKLHFFGTNTTNFTALNSLFINNSHIDYWRFEVTYAFLHENSSSALNFVINKPPDKGSCSISPRNGTTSTVFTISCTGWIDEDEIQDYSFYQRQQQSSDEMIMLGFSVWSVIETRLPSPNNESSSILNLVVHIRDYLNCVREYELEPVTVRPDHMEIEAFVDVLTNSQVHSTNNSILQQLTTGNQNVVGQIVTTISQALNQNNKETLEKTIASGIPASTISISPLGSLANSNKSSSIANNSISSEYIKQLNKLAHIRDYMMKITTGLLTTTIDSIKLQATTLAQLTASTNELTQSAIILASDKCHQLAVKLESIKTKVPFEDARLASNQIAHCINNIVVAINAPLQQRSVFLDSEPVNLDDYDDDMEFAELLSDLMLNGEDISGDNMQQQRTIFYQQKIANQIIEQSMKTVSLLTSILNIHLNIGQQLSLSSSSLVFSLETTTLNSLSNKSIEQYTNQSIRLPTHFASDLSANASISLRSTMQPLAPIGSSPNHAHTNMSTMLTLTIFDQNRNEHSIQADDYEPIEFFIPRDSNVIIPEMVRRTVSDQSTDRLFFLDLNQYMINENLTISIHFEIRPVDINLAYLFRHQFGQKSWKKNASDWIRFCPSELNNEKIYKHFLDNRQTAGHKSIRFQFVELNSTESDFYCQQNQTILQPQTRNFTSDFYLRIYSSGCYYLDRYNNWQSDGLWVGPLTDHYRTHCFSTHL